MLRHSLSTLPSFVGSCAGRCTSSLMGAAVAIHSFPSFGLATVCVCLATPRVRCRPGCMGCLVLHGSLWPQAIVGCSPWAAPSGFHGSKGPVVACVVFRPRGGGPGGGGGCACPIVPSWLKVQALSQLGCTGWLLHACWSVRCCFVCSSHDTWRRLMCCAGCTTHGSAGSTKSAVLKLHVGHWVDATAVGCVSVCCA